MHKGGERREEQLGGGFTNELIAEMKREEDQR
jgi:hypothetical protein